MKAAAPEVRETLLAVGADDEAINVITSLVETLDAVIAQQGEKLAAIRKGRNKLMASYQALLVEHQKLERIVVEQAITIYDLSVENGEMPLPPADRLH